MAGIGFRLQKLLSGDSYTDFIKAYLFSSVIATGPMLVVMIGMGLVKLSLETDMAPGAVNLFTALMVYVYAFSLVVGGPFFYVVTRSIADMYYVREFDRFAPTYLSLLIILFAIQTPLAFFFLRHTGIEATLWGPVIFLYLAVSGIWMAMLFLSAAKDYTMIVLAFVGGGAGGVALSIWLGNKTGMAGFLSGFAVGQVATFFILTGRIFQEFGLARAFDFGFLIYFKKYFVLMLVGFFYYLGIWADKFVFWFSPQGLSVAPGLRNFPLYDTSLFVALLTIIPSMAYFLVQMETSFFADYTRYYAAIRNRENLAGIRACKQQMISGFAASLQKFALFQGAFSGLCILFVYDIALLFYLNPTQMGIFRIGVLAAFLQMSFMILLNVLFYFDCQKEALLACVVYCVSNGLLTAVTLHWGLPAYGFGYAGACFLAAGVAYYLLDRHLRHLNYYTFMAQPILLPKFKFEGEGR